MATWIIFIAAIVAIAASIYLNHRVLLKRYHTQISFKESIDLAELPIVTFCHNGTKLNFLLDTGSNESHIASQFTGLLGDVEKKDFTTDIAGYGVSSSMVSKMCNTTLQYKKYSFDVGLLISDPLNDAFKAVKNECGIQLHGILGTKFLEKYKYVLDFEELVAYQK